MPRFAFCDQEAKQRSLKGHHSFTTGCSKVTVDGESVSNDVGRTVREKCYTKQLSLQAEDESLLCEGGRFRSLHIGNSNTCTRSISEPKNNLSLLVQDKLFERDGSRDSLLKAQGTSIAKTAGCTQDHHSISGHNIQPLLWRFSDYTVSPWHGFSSCSASLLKDKIQEALKQAGVNYRIDDSDSLCYVCEKSIGCNLYKFSILVSSLLRKCQEKLRCRYLVEVSRTPSGDYQPCLWNGIMEALFSNLESIVSFDCRPKPPCEVEESCKTEIKTNRTNADETSDRVAQLNTVSTFIDTMFAYPRHVQLTCLAELYADLSHTQTVIATSRQLRPYDIDKLISLLHGPSRIVHRCTCIVIRNIADAGWLHYENQKDVSKIFYELLKVVHACSNSGSNSQTPDVPTCREAIIALNSCLKCYKPSKHERHLLDVGLQACMKSSISNGLLAEIDRTMKIKTQNTPQR